MVKKKNETNVGLIIGIVAGILFFVLIIGLSINSSSDNSQSSQTDTQSQNPACHDVQTPYEAQEEYMKTEYYTESVPYEENIPLKYEASHFDTVTSPDTGIFYGCGSMLNYAKCFRISIMNIDTVGGIFGALCNMRTIDDTFSQRIDVYVKPGESKEILCIGDVDLGVNVELTNFIVTPPTKTEIDYKDVQRERRVTAYRPVTKYKTETVCN